MLNELLTAFSLRKTTHYHTTSAQHCTRGPRWLAINKIVIIYRCDCAEKNLHISIRISGFHNIDEYKVNIQNQCYLCIPDSQENEKLKC